MNGLGKIENMRRWLYNRKKEFESGYRGNNGLYGIVTRGEFNIVYSKFKEIFENKKPVTVKHETPLTVLSAVTKGYGDYDAKIEERIWKEK